MLRVSEIAQRNAEVAIARAAEVREGVSSLEEQRSRAKAKLQEGFFGQAGYDDAMAKIAADQDALISGYDKEIKAMREELEQSIAASFHLDPEQITPQEAALFNGMVSLTESDMRALHEGYAAKRNYTGMRMVQTAAERAGMTVSDPLDGYIGTVRKIADDTASYGRNCIKGEAYADNGGAILSMLGKRVTEADAAATSFPVVIENA